MYHETHFVPMLRMHGDVRELALDLVHTDGHRVPVLVNARRAAAGDSGVTHVVSFDASHRRQYERELLEAKQAAEDSEARAIALSQTLQATLIPPLPPQIEGLDIAAAFRPAGDGSQVGGDFYDLFQVDDAEWVVAIGDVEGKGMHAAAVTALARHVLRGAAVSSRSPREALLTLNEVLLRAETSRLLTAIVMHLLRTPDGWHAVIACGGHEPPVHKPAGSPAHQIAVRGTILGALRTPQLNEHRVELHAGDLVVLTTDGVHEARAPVTDEFYGAERLVRHLDRTAGQSAAGVIESLLSDVLQFSAGVTRDDIALVGITVDPGVTPWSPSAG